jgi:beta-N-acetylhexosaminidase
MPRLTRPFWLALLLIAGLLLGGNARVSGQDIPAYDQQVETLLAAMSPAERVGQLFLVTFQGDRVTDQSAIADLVANYHIGGVVLSNANDNFTGYGDPANTLQQTLDLTTALQRLALSGEVEVVPPDGVNDDPLPPPVVPGLPANPVPLLIATMNDGDSTGSTNQVSGFTPLPSNMALGATWRPEYARDMGQIAGAELNAAGINMLLGPSLDVLERPSPLSAGDLGTSSFGGDPYWVGVMGQAYVEGIHIGGGDRVAVVASSFPGKGSSDRSVTEEVPTVRKSLEQLKQLELAPFITLAAGDPSLPQVADALLATHIRYQGFQGNIRATTAPVSLDPQALNTLLALPEFAPWRAAGGLVVSDALGVRSIERFYDDTETEFPHRQVAKDALLAGNDLLYVAEFALGRNNREAELANVKDTIRWFEEKYTTDPTFQLRVDDALRRVLKLKFRLYQGQFDPATVLPPPLPEDISLGDTERIFAAAEAAITLLSPSREEMAGRAISAPAINDRMVIFTDVRTFRQCSGCPEQTLLSDQAVQERILALYGPDGSAQVQTDNVLSFSFADLDAFLNAGPGPIALPTPLPTATPPPTATSDPDTADPLPPAPTPQITFTPEPTATPPADFRVQEALREADWIIFAMLNDGINTTDPAANALSRFLAQRPDIAAAKQVVVLAHDAPYFLDSTEISKLSAFYGVYSRTGPFIDAAVRALFLESPLAGAPPVSVEGIRYDLFLQTQPNPEQIIKLFLVLDGETQAPPAERPVDAAIGETLTLQTGVIVDRNGNQVPDGTLVRFMLRDRVQGTDTIIGENATLGGSARLDYILDARMGPGQFRITAESGEATLSEEVDIVIEDEAQLAIIVPTSAPTATMTPTATPTATPEPTDTATPEPPTATPELPVEPPPAGLLLELSDLRALVAMFSGLLTTLVMGTVFDRAPDASRSRKIGRLVWGLVGALALYNYVALGLPGSAVVAPLGSLAGLVVTVAGGAVGLLLFEAVHRR